MVASVALIEDGITKAEYTVNNKKTHSQTLLPMLNEIASMLNEDMSDVDAIAVAAGPGSFTGLRQIRPMTRSSRYSGTERLRERSASQTLSGGRHPVSALSLSSEAAAD